MSPRDARKDSLSAEQGLLVDKKHLEKGLSVRDRLRLEYVRWQLDQWDRDAISIPLDP